MLRDFIKERLPMISDRDMFKVGVYKFPGENRASIDLNLALPLSHEQIAKDIAVELGQHSYLVLNYDAANPFRTVKTGAKGDNTKKLTPEQVRLLAAAAKKNSLPYFMTSRNLLTNDIARVIANIQSAYANWKTGEADALVDEALTRFNLKYHNGTSAQGGEPNV
jgi:hypothetical protein